jgi:hypothetical protein
MQPQRRCIVASASPLELVAAGAQQEKDGGDWSGRASYDDDDDDDDDDNDG